MLFSMLCLCYCYVGHCTVYSNTNNILHSAFQPFQTFFNTDRRNSPPNHRKNWNGRCCVGKPDGGVCRRQHARRAQTARARSSLLAVLILFYCHILYVIIICWFTKALNTQQAHFCFVFCSHTVPKINQIVTWKLRYLLNRDFCVSLHY